MTRPTFKPGPPHPERHRLAATRDAMGLTWQELADHIGCSYLSIACFEEGLSTLAITPDEYRDEIARCRLGLSRNQGEKQ